MKSLLFCFLLTIPLSAIQGQKRVHTSQLDNIKGKIYHRNHVEPFTGTAFDKYNNNKRKVEASIKNGIREGAYKEWYVYGNKKLKVNYTDGNKNGTETQWHSNGKKSLEVNFTVGKANGEAIEWYPSGKEKSRGTFQNGLEEGLHIWYFENGQVDQEIPYSQGTANGPVKGWYKNGLPKMQSQFAEGKKNGPSKEWYQSGQLMIEEAYANGDRNGSSLRYAKNGRVFEENIYQDGVLTESKNFRSADVRIRNGYVCVLNDLEMATQFTVRGEFVRPISRRNWTYLVDGIVVDAVTFNLDSLDSEDVLNSHVQLQQKRIQQELDTLLNFKTERSIPFGSFSAVIWSYADPYPIPNADNPSKNQIYLSMYLGKRILMLSSLSSKKISDTSVLNKLKQIAKTVVTSNDPINLNTVAKAAAKQR